MQDDVIINFFNTKFPSMEAYQGLELNHLDSSARLENDS